MNFLAEMRPPGLAVGKPDTGRSKRHAEQTAVGLLSVELGISILSIQGLKEDFHSPLAHPNQSSEAQGA